MAANHRAPHRQTSVVFRQSDPWRSAYVTVVKENSDRTAMDSGRTRSHADMAKFMEVNLSQLGASRHFRYVIKNQSTVNETRDVSKPPKAQYTKGVHVARRS